MTNFGPRPDQPLGVMTRTLKYNETQEPLLRRLGSALVLHWDALPDALQDVLIDQATLVEDRDPALHERSDIETFLRKVQTAALTKPPAV
jgi:hypothetical protein